MTNPVDRFTAAVAAATIPQAGAFANDAVLDATVPNWRMTVIGRTDIEETFSHWFADAGTFESITRTPLPNGELVEFVLSWEQDGVPHTCHQVHILEVRHDLIVRDTAMCGGRWPAALMAEMAEAALVNA
jgi:hypothetical protein